MNLSRRGLRLCASVSSLAVLATVPFTTSAMAQQQAQAQSIALEEIVVTARKREENLMEVPIAITAFSSRDIEAMNIKQLNDVSLMTPSFNFVNQQGGSGRNDRSANSLVFRGLFLNLNAGLSAGGQLFIDGAPVIGAQPPSIVEVERIEVLKGPQSAYFGRSTFVGAINYITREPGDEFKGKINAEISSWSSHDASMSVEGPIVADKLSGRLSGRHFVRGGQYTNFADTNEKLGRQTTGSVSGSLVFKPSDDLKMKGWANWFEDNDGPPAQASLKQDQFTQRANPDKTCSPLSAPVAPGVLPTSRAALGYWCGELPKINDLPARIISGDWSLFNPVTKNNLFNPNPNWLVFDPQFKTGGGVKRHAFQASFRVDYDFADGYALELQTAYHREKTQTIIDLNYRDGRDRPNPLFSAATATTRVPWLQFLLLSQAKSRDWSQEVRITSPQDQPLRGTVGFNYLDAHSPGGTVYGQTTSGPLFTAAINQQDVETPAVFGAVYYDIMDNLTVSAEARYQWDKIKLSPKVGITGNPVTGAAATPFQDTFKSFSPRVSVDYKYAENSTLYALFSRGYRPGGFNAAFRTASPATVAALLAVVPTAGESYLQERLDNYEVGIKSSWLDGRARTTLTLYTDKWANGQVGNAIPVTIPGPTPGSTVANLINITINNGIARLKGIEAEGEFQVTEEFRISGNFGLNDSTVKSFGLGVGQCGDCNLVYGSFAGIIGNSLPTAPKYTWSLSADYSAPLVGDWNWFARVDYAHRGRNFTDFSNIAWVGASDNVNARIGITRDDLRIEAFVNNLTQNRTVAAGLIGIDVFTFLVPPQRNEIRISPPLPRSVGLRASYNF
ncbi:MAG: TonB-dependent receptor [Rhodospirillaceae bacterium]|nr:TonB-dependent receptor [Rhodospirillaceae bacterium]